MLRRLLGGLALLAGLTLLPPAPAEAQSVNVTNLPQPDTNAATWGLGGGYFANSFAVPGPAGAGHALDSVVVHLGSGATGVTAEIWSESGGEPDAQVGADLVRSGAAASGNITFNAPAGDAIVLKSATTYFLVLRATSAYGVRVTSGGGQGGSSGWTIGDSRHHGSSGTTWTTNTNALRFRVNATMDTAAPTVRTATVRGTSLTLTFTESLAAAANLANGVSTVKRTPSGQGEQSVALSMTTAPAVNGRTVTLTLAAAVSATDTRVKVTYRKPTSGTNNRLKDAANNEVVDIVDRPVINNTGRPTPPTLGTAALNAVVYGSRSSRPAGSDAWRERYGFTSSTVLLGGILPGIVTCATGNSEIGWYKSDALTNQLGTYQQPEFWIRGSRRSSSCAGLWPW